jgi:hypothetical protein
VAFAAFDGYVRVIERAASQLAGEIAAQPLLTLAGLVDRAVVLAWGRADVPMDTLLEPILALGGVAFADCEHFECPRGRMMGTRTKKDAPLRSAPGATKRAKSKTTKRAAPAATRGKTKQYGAAFLHMECGWRDFERQHQNRELMAGSVWDASLRLDRVAAEAPLTPAGERIREIIPEIVRIWTVYPGKQMERGPRLAQATRLRDELGRLSALLSARTVGDVVAAGLAAAFANDSNWDGRLDLPCDFVHDAIWLLLRLGGISKPADLEAFWYSATPAGVVARHRAERAKCRERLGLAPLKAA